MVAMDSLYDIPPGCICKGDGLNGMKCDAPEHAKPKQVPVAIQRLMNEEREGKDPARITSYNRMHTRHNRS
jgi:hypothetical protein